MSRVGKQIIEIPAGVTLNIATDNVAIKGPKGELNVEIPKNISVSVEENIATVKRENEDRYVRSSHGLIRSLIANAVEGVSKGFTKKLIVEGVGFKSNMSGKALKMSLGFSHDITHSVPDDVEVTAEDNVVTVSGIDKQRVGHVAAEIRSYKVPEPYKGKGIRYEDEYIIRKAGKAAGGGSD